MIVELRKDPSAIGSPITAATTNVHLYYVNACNNDNLNDLTPVITPLQLNLSARFAKHCPSTQHVHSCPLDNFVTALQDNLVDDIVSECTLPKDVATNRLFNRGQFIIITRE